MDDLSTQTLTVAPARPARKVWTLEGKLLDVPDGWELLLPGDAGMTRRVKAAGPSWTVVEQVGRRTFSRGVWAPAAHIEAAREGLTSERSTEAYARRRVADTARRERAQEAYEETFEETVLRFLRFAPAFEAAARQMAALVTAHATPVGSGTVARTQRIPVEERAEAAVIAWMRHQTTAYDDMRVERVKGARREVRRELAGVSRRILELHRRNVPHGVAGCPLCTALARTPAP